MAVALRLLLTGLVAVFFLPGSWNFASAWVFNADLRQASNFAPVGVIEFSLPEGRSTGTAFLVGECIVMTNFHVVFGPWYLTQLRPPSNTNIGTFTLTQVTLPNGGHPSTGAIPVIWGDYTGPARQILQPANDWVVLALEECLGSRHGYLLPYDATLNDDIPDRGGFTAVGYSSGRQMVDSNCSIRLSGTGIGATMLNDCVALSGDSGAPIVRRGTNRVVAMVSGFRASFGSQSCSSFKGIVHQPWSSYCTNAAVPFSRPLNERIEAAREVILAQNLFIRLGINAGPYGVIGHPKFAKALNQVKVESGMEQSGESICNLTKILKMRLWGA